MTSKSDFLEGIKYALSDIDEALKTDDFEKARLKIEDIEEYLEDMKDHIDTLENDSIEE